MATKAKSKTASEPAFGRRIGIIGAGPVGSVLAAHFAAAGHEVVLCDVVEALLAPAKKPGIRIEGVESITGAVAQTIRSVDEMAKNPPDVIFVTVKATALPLIASALQAFHKPGICVVSWQNGIDTEAVLAEHVDEKWVFRAVVNFGVTLKEPGHVYMAFHHPPHWLQEYNEAGKEHAEKICGLLTNAGLPTRRADRIHDKIWQKVILNAALSSVCAVSGKTMSGALADPYLNEMVEALVREGIAVARANEISVGWDFYMKAIKYLSTAGDHKPSMLIDIEMKRTTEVDYINGAIVKYAERAGVPAPFNKMIRALVKTLEPVR